MTIRRRLTLSFLVILILFAVNLLIYFWGNQRRESTVEALRRAISRQSLISSISQSLNDVQKQVTLLTQAATEPGATGVGPDETEELNRRLKTMDDQIAEVRELSDPEVRGRVESIKLDYQKLSASWGVFFKNFGTDQTKAIEELVLTAEPLAQEVLQVRLPQLQRDEKARVEAASANFYKVARLTNRTTILIFAVSAILLIGVAVLVSRQLTRGLERLRGGAASIGSGNLEQLIEIRGNDELADLGRVFNEMTGKLFRAHEELTQANFQERKGSEKLRNALDELRKMQKQLLVQEKLASLGSLTAGIAHEIKNPLNFVTNFAEVSLELAKEIEDSLKSQRDRMDPNQFADMHEALRSLKQNVTRIHDHGKRADGIVRNMLMHSRGQAGQSQMTNINSLLSEYVKLAYHGMRAQDSSFNVTIEEEYDPTLDPISVVPHDLSRAFLNVASNACFAAAEKKKLAGEGFSPTVTATTRNLEQTVEVRIRDNGDGVPESVRQRIFEPFFTTKPAGSGTGLGLSMTYEIVVQQHKGDIRLETEPGRYAEFIITLPKHS